MLCLFLTIVFLVCKHNSPFLIDIYNGERGYKKRTFQLFANNRINVRNCVPTPPSCLLFIIEGNVGLLLALTCLLGNIKLMNIPSLCCIDILSSQPNPSHWRLNMLMASHQITLPRFLTHNSIF